MHDIDYEKTKDNPTTHGLISIDILKPFNLDDEILESIKGHNEMLGLERKTLMAKALFCVDQLSGLIVASTLVLPSKKIQDLTLDSIMKKFKEKSFAKGAKRENISLCESDLNIKLEDFILIALKAMQSVASEIGL
ncbi:MAG TPA: phosphohydrolase [Candidatus Paceibacterota bacterium]|nr:phosphohydrolase [Candidatus Paceibacterota bacterium]HRZ29609.1 phosphohydrolase [Candidatus Paceibacterota bacterium]